MKNKGTKWLSCLFLTFLMVGVVASQATAQWATEYDHSDTACNNCSTGADGSPDSQVAELLQGGWIILQFDEPVVDRICWRDIKIYSSRSDNDEVMIEFENHNSTWEIADEGQGLIFKQYYYADFDGWACFNGGKWTHDVQITNIGTGPNIGFVIDAVRNLDAKKLQSSEGNLATFRDEDEPPLNDGPCDCDGGGAAPFLSTCGFVILVAVLVFVAIIIMRRKSLPRNAV